MVVETLIRIFVDSCALQHPTSIYRLHEAHASHKFLNQVPSRDHCVLMKLSQSTDLTIDLLIDSVGLRDVVVDGVQ